MAERSHTRESILDVLNERAEEMSSRFSVRRIGLFGSYINSSADEKSDIDILVGFEKATFDNYMDLKFFLEEIFQRKVDLVIEDAIKPRLRPYIMEEVEFAEGL
jgi:predicted nucleotidyltransferase